MVLRACRWLSPWFAPWHRQRRPQAIVGSRGLDKGHHHSHSSGCASGALRRWLCHPSLAGNLWRGFPRRRRCGGRRDQHCSHCLIPLQSVSRCPWVTPLAVFFTDVFAHRRGRRETVAPHLPVVCCVPRLDPRAPACLACVSCAQQIFLCSCTSSCPLPSATTHLLPSTPPCPPQLLTTPPLPSRPPPPHRPFLHHRRSQQALVFERPLLDGPAKAVSIQYNARHRGGAAIKPEGYCIHPHTKPVVVG